MKALFVVAAVVFFVALLGAPAHGQVYNYGVDVSGLVSVSQFKCLSSSNPVISHVIARGYRSTGSSDPNVVQTLKNAVAAGYSPSNLGVYIFPRPLNSAGTIQDGGVEVKNMMDNLIKGGAGALFKTVWLDIEGGDLYWSRVIANNVKFVEQMIAQAKTYQPTYNVGIYTSKSQWSPIVGSSYTGGKDFPLWYASYNGKTDFGDFTPFAGWTAPTLHQYAGDKTVCGVGADLNVMPSGTLWDQAGKAKANGGSGTPTPPIANSAQCAAAHGVCSDIQKSPCVGTVQHGLCPGSASIVCCVGAPVLRSSPGTATVARQQPSTDAKVVAEAVDTGKVSWHRDRRGRRAARTMKMGTLMRIRRKQRKHKNEHSKKKKRVKATPARVRDD